MRRSPLCLVLLVGLWGCSAPPPADTPEKMIDAAKSVVEKFCQNVPNDPQALLENVDGLKDTLSSLSDDDPTRLAPVNAAVSELEQVLKKTPGNTKAIQEKVEALAAAARGLSAS